MRIATALLLGTLALGTAWAQPAPAAEGQPSSGAVLTEPALAPASQIAARAAAIPAESFFRTDSVSEVKLSPSGRWLALKTSLLGNRVGIVVFDQITLKPLPKAFSYSDADVEDFFWVDDERIVFDVADRKRGGGDQRWWPGLFSASVDGKEQRELVRLVSPVAVAGRAVSREPLPYNHTLLHVPATPTGSVIVGEWRWNGAREFAGLVAKRLDVSTGRAVTVSMGAPENVWQWFFDPKGEPRAVVTQYRGRRSYHWRAPGSSSEWRQLVEFRAQEPPYLLRHVDSEGQLYVTQQDARGNHVFKRFDFATGKPEAEPLVTTPGFDFQGEIVSETAGAKALGVHVVTDAETTVWFDRRLAALQLQADERLPGRVNRLTCRRCTEPDMTVLVTSYSDRDPGQFWLYRAEAGDWRKIANRRSDLPVELMGTTEFERIKARDGLEIPVWVTKPAGPAVAGRPAVVLVHGGPWVRGRSWNWNADAQFLASRGYVVIEPEFRGSTGYGAALHRAGFRQWGRGMQDDVADALAWAVGKGWVDSMRVCIAGASYGGYATLMGLVRHPELYRCGVAWAAVTDPRLLFEWRSDSDMHTESREYSLPTMIGDPAKDAAMLEAVTPVLLASRIQAPLLLAFGGNDRRVPLVHGTRLRNALETAGRPPQWVVYDDEGHGWFKLDTRVDFANRLEAFLARHLK